MPYVINIESKADGRLAPPERRTVSSSRMTIGRGAECSVRLDDQKKHVSRVHAVVDLQGASHVLSVTSSMNPVILNGAKLGPGESAAVKPDDVIQIGDFTVQLLEVHRAGPTPGASSARPPAASPFDFGLAGGGDTVPGASDDPFRALDDLIPAKPKPAAPPPGPEPDPFFAAPRKSAAAPASDGLIEGLGGMSHRDLGGTSSGADQLMNLLNAGAAFGAGVGEPTFNPQPLGPSAASLDRILGSGAATPIGRPLADLASHHAGGSSSIDHVQPVNMAFTPPQIRSEPRPASTPPPAAPARAPSADPFDGFDPFASLIGPAHSQPAAPPPPIIDPQPEFVPEPPPPPPPPRVVAAPEPPPATSAMPASASIAAFLEGAGLPHIKVSDAEAEAFLRESGAIVRAAVEGLIGLLLARSELKKEIRAEDRTMVASRDNNPLKLMSDASEALSFLFDSRSRLSGAFLPPVQAVQDACDDLRVHEIALMAGMRAAFQGALRRFDPKLIEREVDKQSSSFTLNKKVKLWEAFVAHHEKVSRDAEDDLLKVFGKELLGTYMAQVKRLRTPR